MAAAETAKLLASLELQDKNFTANANKAIATTGHMESSFAKMGANIGKHVSAGMGAAVKNVERGMLVIGGLVASQVAFGLRSLADQQNVNTQTAAAIKSTGAAAHVTALQVEELSNALEDKTTIDNKEIQAAANLMLTFTNVRNEAGAGNDVFNQSVAVLTDLATAMHTDVSAGAIQLGKALNDPVKGITALTRIGVTFDAQQQKQIKTLVAHGKLMQAQKIILAELNREFGGSAAASADTYEGKLRRLGDAWEGIQQAIAEAALPATEEFATFANKTLRDPATVEAVKGFGRDLGTAMKSGLGWLKDNWQVISGALRTLVGIAKDLVGAFAAMPSWAQQLLVGGFVANKFTGGMVTNIAGDLFKGAGGGLLGLLRGIGSKLPGPAGTLAGAASAATATPVFVTNWPTGFGPGGGPIPTGPGLIPTAIGLAALVATAAGVVEALRETAEFRSAQDKLVASGMTRAQALQGQLDQMSPAAREYALHHGAGDALRRLQASGSEDRFGGVPRGGTEDRFEGTRRAREQAATSKLSGQFGALLRDRRTPDAIHNLQSRMVAFQTSGNASLRSMLAAQRDAKALIAQDKSATQALAPLLREINQTIATKEWRVNFEGFPTSPNAREDRLPGSPVAPKPAPPKASGDSDRFQGVPRNLSISVTSSVRDTESAQVRRAKMGSTAISRGRWVPTP